MTLDRKRTLGGQTPKCSFSGLGDYGDAGHGGCDFGVGHLMIG